MSSKRSAEKKIEDLKIEQMPIEELIPYAGNARTHSVKQVAQIAASIKEFGFNNPILIDSEKGVIAGHGRLEAARKLKRKSVPVVRLEHLTDVQKRAYILADNRLALDAGWDEQMLASELQRLQSEQMDLSLLGFDEEELKKALGEVGLKNEGLTDPDEVPEVPQNVHNVQRGQVWKLGRHRLMCGDSTDDANVLMLMDGKRAPFCFTSPPYSDQRDYNGGKDLSTKKLARFLNSPCDLFAVNLGMQRKDGEVFPYWDDYLKAARDAGHKFLSWNIWDRGEAGSIGNQTAMFAITHEWVFVFGSRRDLNLTQPNISAGHLTRGTIRQADGTLKKWKDQIIRPFSQMRTVFQCSAEKACDEFDHPARFPVAFAEGYVEACSDAGDIVYEPFCGSGSTLIACEKTGRTCYGMELDEHYCSVIIERWQKFTGQKAELVE